MQWTPLNMDTSGQAKNGRNSRWPELSEVFIQQKIQISLQKRPDILSVDVLSGVYCTKTCFTKVHFQ